MIFRFLDLTFEFESLNSLVMDTRFTISNPILTFEEGLISVSDAPSYDSS